MDNIFFYLATLMFEISPCLPSRFTDPRVPRGEIVHTPPSCRCWGEEGWTRGFLTFLPLASLLKWTHPNDSLASVMICYNYFVLDTLLQKYLHFLCNAIIFSLPGYCKTHFHYIFCETFKSLFSFTVHWPVARLLYFFGLRWRSPPLPWDFTVLQKISCSSPGKLWKIPDSNPGPQKSVALPLSHHIYGHNGTWKTRREMNTERPELGY